MNLVNDYKKIENKSINEKNLGHLIMTAPSLLDLHDIELRILTKVLGIMTNKGYLDKVAFRVMRYYLWKTFDEIYILNLHDSSRKKKRMMAA